MKKNIFHTDLITLKDMYESYGWQCTNIVTDKESADYGACRFTLNNTSVLFRVAKITPTKIGQFVTLWKRIGASPIMPFDVSDPVDLFIITVRQEELFGCFIFPKKVLLQQGFISQNGKDGKRAMRVYSPWDKPDSKQGQRTQNWQLAYFVELAPNCDVEKIKSCFYEVG